MKIINARLDDTQFVIEIDNLGEFTKVYIDTIDNRDNMFSKEDYLHSYVFTKDQVTINEQNIIITSDQFKAMPTNGIVSIVDKKGLSDTKFIINEGQLYLAKVNLLDTYCSTCLDKHQKENILMCEFKSNLLDYALKNNLIEAATDYYTDLCRLLNITEQHCCAANNRFRCRTCVNGCCSL